MHWVWAEEWRLVSEWKREKINKYYYSGNDKQILQSFLRSTINKKYNRADKPLYKDVFTC